MLHPTTNLVARRLLAFVFILALIPACGGDGDPTTPSGPRQVFGQVTKGPVSDASVSLQAIGTDGTPAARVGGPYTTDAAGAWAGELAADVRGPFLLVATGGSYEDEVSGTPVDLGSAQLLGYSANGSGQVTPYTHTLVLAAAARIDGGESPAVAWSSVLATFENAFGFDPTVIAPSTGSTDARTYLALLGGISELLHDNVALSGLAGATAIDRVLAIAADLSDGVLNGIDADGGSIEVPVGTGTVTWPVLDATGIGALIDAVNAYAAATAGLDDISLDSVDLAFGDPTTGNGSGAVTFSGPATALLSQTSFIPAAFVANGSALAWSTDTVTFFAQVGVSRSPTDPTRAIIVTVNTVSEGGAGYGWSAIAFETGSFVPGVTLSGNDVTFTNVVLPGTAGTDLSLTVNGALGE